MCRWAVVERLLTAGRVLPVDTKAAPKGVEPDALSGLA
jgi:hypothetical protein